MNKRIAVISKYFYPSSGGGERQLLYFIKALKYNYCIDIYTTQYNAKLPKVINEKNIFLYSPNQDTVVKSFNDILFRLKKTTYNYEFIYMVIYHKNGIIEQLKIIDLFHKKNGKIILRFSSLGEATEFFYSKIDISIFYKVDRIVSLSPYIKKELINIGCPEEKIYPFLNPVDTSLFFPKKKQQTNKLLVLSRPHPKKKWFDIVNAWNHTKSEGNLTFIFNENESKYLEEYRKKVEKYSKTLKRSSSIFFIENICMEEAPLRLRDFDAIISASINEGMQNVLLEALASGLKVIAPFDEDFDYLQDYGVFRYNRGVNNLRDTIELALNTERNNFRKVIAYLNTHHSLDNYLKLLESNF